MEAKVPEYSRQQKFLGANGPGSELARVLRAHLRNVERHLAPHILLITPHFCLHRDSLHFRLTDFPHTLLARTPHFTRALVTHSR